MDIQMVSSLRAEPAARDAGDSFAAARVQTGQVAAERPASVRSEDERTDKRPIRVFRRMIDIAVASTGLLVLGIPMLVLAAIIVIDSRGAAWYGSWRLSRGARPFRCWKFRTMHDDAHTRLEHYLADNKAARQEYDRYHKLTHDPRITRAGRFLRGTSLDELPQLVNVLVGQMSLVGPRPYLVEELLDRPEASDILCVKPGIKGLWQVSGRNELTFRQRVRIESFYARRRSLGWDAAILVRTAHAVARRVGAR